MNEVLSREELTTQLLRLRIASPLIARKAQAGQFVMVMADEKGERIPLTLADWNSDEGSISVALSAVGKTTDKIRQLKVGERLAHVAGPLGKPSPVDYFGRVIFVALGYGILAQLPIARALKGLNNDIASIMWTPNEDLVAVKEEWQQLGPLIQVTGEGSPTFVLEPLRQLLDQQKVDQVRVQGPACVMRLCSLATQPFGVRTLVSLNPIMVDGTGMCGSCRVSVAGETKFACVDGPDFDGHQVNWDLFLLRRCTYSSNGLPSSIFRCRSCSQW